VFPAKSLAQRRYAKAMLRALGFVVVAASTSIAWAQFDGLATPYDGSAVYFSSTLRLKGTNQPNYEKLFVADEHGVRLFHALPRVDPKSADGSCVLGDQYTLDWAQVTADGSTVAGLGQRSFAGNCNLTYFPSTDLIAVGGERQSPGFSYLSPSGRYAAVNTPALAVVDLQTGASTPIPTPPDAFSNFGFVSRRPIADNGTVILGSDESVYGLHRGYIAMLGKSPESFPVPDGIPVAISANGAQVLYHKSKTDEYHLFDLNTKQDQLVLANGFAPAAMSDDARRILLWSDRPYIIQSDGTGLRPLTKEPEYLISAVQPIAFSGDGRTVYAATTPGRLLKINVDTGEEIELVGRTPYAPGAVGASVGLETGIAGTGLTDASIEATPPLGDTLANVRVRLDLPGVVEPRGGVVNRHVYLPIIRVTTYDIRFLVPWNLKPLPRSPAQPLHLVIEAPGVNTPFDFPDMPMYLKVPGLSFSPLNVHPHPGEVFQVLAWGLGAVYPDVPVGWQAPSVEPLARLVKSFTCNDGRPLGPATPSGPQPVPVLYAGLLPGSLDRTYEVTLQAPNGNGYYSIRCSLGGGAFFDVVTIQEIP
jgi:hypothetical protein